MARCEWVREEILTHALKIERLEQGVAVEFSATPELIGKVDRLIELERDCCPGIAFERLADKTAGRARLEIHGVDPDAAIFALLAPPGGRPLGRLAKSVVVGVAGSLFVCCVLPVGAAVLLGTAATPRVGLDGLLPIAVGAIVGGAAKWLWAGRDSSRGGAQAGNCASNCGDGR